MICYTVRIKRVVWHEIQVEATDPSHAVARAEMKCPATGSAWQIKSERCEVIAVSPDGKALSETIERCSCLGLSHRTDCPQWQLPY